VSSQGKRLTKPELEEAIRSMLPQSESAAILKKELADLRANLAEWLYRNSEPIPDDEKTMILPTFWVGKVK